MRIDAQFTLSEQFHTSEYLGFEENEIGRPTWQWMCCTTFPVRATTTHAKSTDVESDYKEQRIASHSCRCFVEIIRVEIQSHI
jgi:hypothetical protein